MQSITKFARRNPLTTIHIVGTVTTTLCLWREFAFGDDFSWMRPSVKKVTFWDRNVAPAFYPGVMVGTYCFFAMFAMCPPFWINMLRNAICDMCLPKKQIPLECYENILRALK